MEHHFNTNLAKEYGIEEAILLHHFYYWIVKNAANEKHFHDGLYWTYNSKKAYSEFFQYINETKIFRVIKHLEEEGVVVKGKYNQDKFDKTNWYALSYKGWRTLISNGYDANALPTSFQNAIFDSCKMNDGVLQNEQTIPNNNTNNNKEENTNVFPKKNDYREVIECWNEYNGDKLGKVTKITDKRKRNIKKQLEDNGISQQQLIMFFKSLPYADKWLYNPNKQHKNWKPDFDWWMANSNGWLTKALEGKVHLENPQVFANIMLGKDAPYTPVCEGALNWNDYYGCYMYVGYWNGFIPDGYTDDNRPDGATITLNNGRGTVTWDGKTKTWIKN